VRSACRPTEELPHLDAIAYPFAPADALTIDPRYRELQQGGPVRVQLPFGEPAWLATRYDDVKVVYSDRRFGRVLGLTHDAPGMWPSDLVKDPSLLVNMDPPEHTRVRRLTSGAFSPARVQQLEDRIQGLVDHLCDDLAADGPRADFVAHFSSKLPLFVIAGILGVPEEETGQIVAWVDELIGVDLDPAARGAAHQHLREFVVGLIRARRERRTDDLLSVLVEARDEDDRLSEDELFGLTLALWLGGIDTTHNELGSMVFALLTHRDRWQQLVDDPELLPAALEELWRWIPSHKYGVLFPRWPVEDVELSGGVVARAGEPVIPEHTVANRDEAVYPHGWELDFHRDDPAPHFTFAFGAHHCMGASLARLEVRLAIGTLLRRFPSLDLAIPAGEITWSTTSMLRSVEALPLIW
jgi:cytochrome P450